MTTDSRDFDLRHAGSVELNTNESQTSANKSSHMLQKKKTSKEQTKQTKKQNHMTKFPVDYSNKETHSKFNTVSQPWECGYLSPGIMDLLGLDRQIACCWKHVPSRRVRTQHKMFTANSDLLSNSLNK